MKTRYYDEYVQTIQSMDEDELHKEYWMLDTHLQYLNNNDDGTILEITEMFSILKNEMSRRNIIYNQS